MRQPLCYLLRSQTSCVHSLNFTRVRRRNALTCVPRQCHVLVQWICATDPSAAPPGVRESPDWMHHLCRRWLKGKGTTARCKRKGLQITQAMGATLPVQNTPTCTYGTLLCHCLPHCFYSLRHPPAQRMGCPLLPAQFTKPRLIPAALVGIAQLFGLCSAAPLPQSNSQHPCPGPACLTALWSPSKLLQCLRCPNQGLTSAFSFRRKSLPKSCSLHAAQSH